MRAGVLGERGRYRRAPNRTGHFPHVAKALIAGAVILLTAFRRADSIASLIIAAIMLHAAWGLLRDSGRVFLEAPPRGTDVDAIGNAMAAQPVEHITLQVDNEHEELIQISVPQAPGPKRTR